MDAKTAITLQMQARRRYRRGFAGNVAAPDGCGPCQPYNASTCTPCEGPMRRQRWGGAYMLADFGGRMTFRACPNPVDPTPSSPLAGALAVAGCCL